MEENHGYGWKREEGQTPYAMAAATTVRKMNPTASAVKDARRCVVPSRQLSRVMAFAAMEMTMRVLRKSGGGCPCLVQATAAVTSDEAAPSASGPEPFSHHVGNVESFLL